MLKTWVVSGNVSKKLQSSSSSCIVLNIFQVKVDEDLRLFLQQVQSVLIVFEIRNDEIGEQRGKIFLKEGLHVFPKNEAFEVFEAVEYNFIVIGIWRCLGAEIPNFLGEAFDGVFDIILVLTGIEQDGLKSCSFASEDELIQVGELHDGIEDGHPGA